MVVVVAPSVEEKREGGVVLIREYQADRDREAVENLERMCEVGPSGGGGMSLFTDLLGDPLCRVRHSPSFLMLVAEIAIGQENRAIVGIIRGCVKIVTCGTKKPRLAAGDPAGASPVPIYAKVAYLLGLRVSPFHRRKGIGLKLVERMEEWCEEKGAEYAYMATEKDNEASIQLFTGRCGYTKFRTPAILVQPVFAHRIPLPGASVVLRLPSADAEVLYRRRFAGTEFFPRDIDAVLRNPLSLGTFLAVPAGCAAAGRWQGAEAFLEAPPPSWAVASVWNSKALFRLEVRGAARWRQALAQATRAVDRALPWLRIPSVPDLFRPFGLYLVYGLGGEGFAAPDLTRSLFRHAHNMARRDAGCRVVAAEVAACDPLRHKIPYWRRLSCAEDLWCLKRLAGEYGEGGTLGDWTKAPPPPSIFVDPREF
ncbi:probable N-acetyltransferase HLS1 [Zingiber officinale]|uniref:probable N-acetyltransferase HLS1 n=1 Tax=Zingiber officinale TaxID=94328 RepID=UPI001C4C6DB7|nr:probable N-acetyltransferase HLS1 [Zingiber officinale]